MMRRYAMLMGSYLGGFLILKFLFFPLGLTVPFCSLLFLAMTLCVPFMGYAYVRMYRDKVCGGTIGWLHAWSMHIQLYLYASLLASIPHYLYFRFWEQGTIAATYQAQWEEMKAAGMEETSAYSAMFEDTVQTLQQLTPMDWTINLISSDLMAGILLGLPVALIVRRERKNEE